MLEKRETLLHKKMAAELAKAKEFNRAKNKRAALQCLKKKKLYEQQVENLQNHQLKLEEQVITLEGSKTTAETFDARRSGAGASEADPQGDQHRRGRQGALGSHHPTNPTKDPRRRSR